MSFYDGVPILARRTGININVTNTDYELVIPNTSRRYHFQVIISNPSVDASGTWTYGLFSATGGNGTILGNGANQRAGLATPTTGVAVSTGTLTAVTDAVYFRVGTALGTTGTVDVTIIGYPVS